ncbi:MAG: polysaccharide biosynthesis protein [Ruminococcaceae bacterium]|nr:polysaccharide biosynthesis protein [Oscillospiraceae bacterium]
MNDNLTKNKNGAGTPHKKHAFTFGKRKILLLLIDIVCFVVSYIAATVFAGVFDQHFDATFSGHLLVGGIILALIMLVRLALSVYRTIWRYPNVRAYLGVVVSDVIGGLVAGAVIRLLVPSSMRGYLGFSEVAFVVVAFDLVTLTSRFCYQLLHLHKSSTKKPYNSKVLMNKIGVAILGAGQIGIRLAEELTLNPLSHYKPICFIDNDPAKVGARIQGLEVLEENENVIHILKNMPVQEIFIALPNISSKRAAELYEFFGQTGCKIKMYDYPVKDMATDEEEENASSRRKLRELHIEDLLFRDPLAINDPEAKKYYTGKTVLVTGGGGSIGSELCRQIAKCKPRRLIILDIYENNAYAIQQELIRIYKDKLNIVVEIGSVRDVARLDSIFRMHKPNVVFHAAAHKHVPLMEHSSCEAIKNNVMGTYNVANAAELHGVEKFILISTDKAVNPTNIMGASKRMCEMIVQCRADSNTSFAAVRFGNVLGSNGSVIPLFREQIEKGGPITITDKKIIRYFMTIPEASQLVMQAGAMAKSGELFVLDMGKPIRILDLAENMIKLSGLVPYKDIDIVEIGLRPGEKLYEELLIKSETLSTTSNKLIFIEKDAPLTRDEVEDKLRLLKDAVERSKCDSEASCIKRAMKRAVPTYNDPEFVNLSFEDSEEKRQSEEDEAAKESAPIGASL